MLGQTSTPKISRERYVMGTAVCKRCKRTLVSSNRLKQNIITLILHNQILEKLMILLIFTWDG